MYLVPHDLHRNGFVLHRAVRPLEDLARNPAASADNVKEPLQLRAHGFALAQERPEGKTLLRKQRIDVRTRIAEALSDVDQAASARGQQIMTSDMPEPLWVDGDAARLRQALANLLDNAVKFTEPGGRIQVSAWRDGQHILVRVSDAGRGLRPHEVAHTFELFSQARPGDDYGLGAGLNAAWEIVALHRGRIDVRSAGPFLGTEFTVTLPSTAQKD